VNATEYKRFLEVINGESEVIPPFGLMRVESVDVDGIATVKFPAFAGQTDLIANGHTQIPPGGRGQAQTTFPASVAYWSTPESPVVGEFWGVRPDSFYLQKTASGFAINAAPIGNKVLVDKATTTFTKLLKITSRVAETQIYNATEQNFNPVTEVFEDGEEVTVFEPNNTNSGLVIGLYAHGTLQGNSAGKRVYTVDSAASGSGSGSGSVQLRRELAGICWLPCTSSGSGSSGSGSSGSGVAEFCVNGYKLVNKINLVDPRTNETVSTVCEDVGICDDERGPCYEPPTGSSCACMIPLTVGFDLSSVGPYTADPPATCRTYFIRNYEMAYDAPVSGGTDPCIIAWTACYETPALSCGAGFGPGAVNARLEVFVTSLSPTSSSFVYYLSLFHAGSPTPCLAGLSVGDIATHTFLYSATVESTFEAGECVVPFPVTLEKICASLPSSVDLCTDAPETLVLGAV
jgi:hypothetical protein